MAILLLGAAFWPRQGLFYKPGNMPIITLTDVHKSFGPEVVFAGLSQRFYGGEKVGLIGPNGSGKTTLLRLILGDIEPETGQIVRRKGLRMGYLPQEPGFDGEKTVIEQMHAGLEHISSLHKRMVLAAERLELLSGDELKAGMQEYERLCREFELADGYSYENRIHTILAGVGLGEDLYETRTEVLSGGQLSRLGLAQALFGETDLLLLDEPTNHLDLEATTWLEKFLKAYAGAVVLISHDRYLLDAVACKIVEVRENKAVVWRGNYSQYVEEKAKQGLEKEREYKERLEMVRKTEDFIARNKDKEGMRKTARGRKRRLKKLLDKEPDFLSKPQKERKIRFGFSKTTSKSDLALRAEGLGKAFGPLVLFEDLSFDVLMGERLGITGPNGTGKSTLLKMALGQIEATSGTVRVGQNLTVGYLDQHGGELDPDSTVLEEAR
jgi:ATP-binding cassette subfamily F protein 3